MNFKEKTKYYKSLGITKPTVIFDKNKAIKNIDRMMKKAEKSGVCFRPHFKTHQSVEIADLFRQKGIKTITVSSLEMAGYFAEAGWVDITVAFPVNPLEIIEIKKLSQKVNLSIIADNIEVVKILKEQLNTQVKIFIKIDMGYGRAGIPIDALDEIETIVREISNCEYLFFQGLLTHAGNTYNAKSQAEIKEIYQRMVNDLKQVKSVLVGKGYENCQLSIGDTPACSIVEDFEGVDEIRPGNFVFYDLVQESLGVCTADDIAVVVACPVVGKYPERGELVVYGGGVHFSKDVLVQDGANIYGYLAPYGDRNWKGIEKEVYISSLSQEHGKVVVPKKYLDKISIGDILTFYPVHSCMTVYLHKHYVLLDGSSIPKM